MEKKSKGTVLIPIVAGYYYSIDKAGNHTLYFKAMKAKQEFGKRGVYTGEEREVCEVIGYYSDLTSLLKAVVKNSAFRKIDDGEIKSVKDYIDSLKSMAERIETITGGY